MNKYRFSMTISGELLANNPDEAPDILDQSGLRITPADYNDGVVVNDMRITCDGEMREHLHEEID